MKSDELLIHARMLMDREIIMLSERCQTKRRTHCIYVQLQKMKTPL